MSKKDRQVLTIYDAIIRLLFLFYNNSFLHFLGVDEDILERVDQKIQTAFGKKVRMDFIARLTNDELFNVEAHKGHIKENRYKEYFLYSAIASTYYGGNVRQLILRFCKSTVSDKKCVRINHHSLFFPNYFYIDDLDFDAIIKKINKKVQTYIGSEFKSIIKLTKNEEIALLLRVTVDGFTDYYETLKEICKLLEIEDLFEDDTYLFFRQILNFEVRNFLSDSERDQLKKEVSQEILEVVNVGPELELLISGNLKEVSERNAQLIREEAISEGLSEGDYNARVEIARNLRGMISDEKIAEITSLSLSIVRQL